MRSDEARSDEASWWSDVETDPIHIAAADWLMRLQAHEVPGSDIADWLNWMHADVRHTVAFDRIEQISSIAHLLSPTRSPHPARLAEDLYDGSVPLGGWRRLPDFRRSAIGIAASVVLALLIGVAGLYMALGGDGPGAKDGGIEQTLDTLVAENRTLVLSDGTRLTLGGRSRVKVSLGKQKRAVTLQQGEAYFEVAKDPMRPFVVNAGAVTVTAVGTAFNINQSASMSVVTVTEGRVRVRSSSVELPGVHLSAGEQASADATGLSKVVQVADLGSVIAWRMGRLSFREKPLRDALQDVNRYAHTPLVLGTPSIGEIVITGTVSINNIGGWLTSLERAFGLIAVEESDRIRLELASAKDLRMMQR